MNLDNFVVRPRRRLVEKYGESKAWAELSASDRAELGGEGAGLPSEQPAEPEETRRFDLLMLDLQLSLLGGQPAAFTCLQDQVQVIASSLEDKATRLGGRKRVRRRSVDPVALAQWLRNPGRRHTIPHCGPPDLVIPRQRRARRGFKGTGHDCC
jgi:hypothetical protein